MATSTTYRRAVLATTCVFLAPVTIPAVGAQRDGATAPSCRYCPAYTGPSGAAEIGVGVQDDDTARIGRYTGLNDDGGHVVANGRVGYRGEAGAYVEAAGDDLGLDSRRLAVEGGIQGRITGALEYDEIPNYRDATSHSPYRESGDRLVLPDGWSGGANTRALPTLRRDLRRVPLETEREALGLGFSYTPLRQWEIFGHARREDKDGIQDLGATFGFDQTVILPAPVDYETDDVRLGIGYTGDRLQAQIAYDGSMFENDRDAVEWQNPFDPDEIGRLAAAPDNAFHQITGMLGYALGKNTRMNAKLALGRMTQDDDLLPYAVNGAAPPVSDIDAEVDTTLAEVRLSSHPTPDLRWNVDYTYSERDNETDRRRWDYVVTDRTNPAGTRVNTPYSFSQSLLRARMAYRLPKSMEVQAGARYDRIDRTFQSVDETHEYGGWGRLSFRPREDMEAAFEASVSRRDKTGYEQVAHLTDFDEVQHPLMRIYNLTDRDRQEFGASLSWALTPAVTVAVDFDAYEDDYEGTGLGLQEGSGQLATGDLSVVFSERLSASAFVTHDRLRADQAGLEFWQAPWQAESEYTTNTFGVGVNWAAVPGKLDLRGDLTYSEHWGEISYRNAPDFPDIESEIVAVNLRGDYRLDERQSLVVRLRYESYDEDDWAKDGAVNDLATVLDLGRAELDEEAVMVSVAYRYRFD